MKMTKKELVKNISSTVVTVGVGRIVTNAITVLTPLTPIGPIARVAVWVGSMVLSDMVTSKAVDHVDKRIEEATKFAKEMIEEEKSEEEKKID